MKVTIYNQSGTTTGEQELNPAVFEVAIQEDLVHQVVVAQDANARAPIAHTKQRSEVKGGGRKPWKQKGTGRARHGTIRSPLWRGGGVTFGPLSIRNFTKNVNKKMKRKALLMALSDKAAKGRVILLDQLQFEEAKTKQFVEVVDALGKAVVKEGTPAFKKVLFVMPETDMNFILSSRNIQKTKVIRANSLNIKDIMHYDYIVMPVASLETIEQTYLN